MNDLCGKNLVLQHTEYLCPPKFTCWNPIPNGMVFGSGVRQRWLGYEIFMKETPERSIAPSAMRTRQEDCQWTRKWALTKSAGALILDFQPPEL